MKRKTAIRYSIGFKLILIISLILTLSLMGLTYITTMFFQGDSEKRIQEVTSDKSKVLALKVQTDLKSMVDRVNLIAYTSLSHTSVESESGLDRYQRQLLKNEQSILYAALLQKDGDSIGIKADFINSTLVEKLKAWDFSFSKTLLKESVQFKQAFDGVTHIHNSSQYFDFPILTLSYPLPSEDEDAIKQILVVYFSMDAFLEAVQSINEYSTYIVNRSGELVAHSDYSLLKNNINFANDAIVRKMLTSPLNNGQMSYRDEAGIDQIGSYRKVDFADMGVISTVKREVALEAVKNLRQRNLYITIIFLVLSMMVVYLFAKTLTNPVKRLVAAAKKISSGDYRLVIKPASRDEIGELTESFIEMGQGLEEREKMKEAFGKFVNKEIAELALKGELKLGGEKKSAAIFFSDIRSFTAISEKLKPEEVVEFLNEYMTAMVDCVNQTHGVVDKFIGDAVMAVWGTPVSHGNDTENAVNGALMMRQALIKFNKGRGSAKKPIIKIGCGINTGDVIAGQIGSQERMEYTVIGDAVNLASRIESLNKPFGTDILISADAYNLVKDIYNVEAMQKITVKGKVKPQQIYAVIGRKDDPTAPKDLQAVRKLLKIKNVNIAKVDVNKKEVKYEIKKK